MGSYPAQTDAIVGYAEVDVATAGPETCREHNGALTPMPRRPVLTTNDVTVAAPNEAIPVFEIRAEGVKPPGLYHSVSLRVVTPAPVTVSDPVVSRLATHVGPKEAEPVFNMDAFGNYPPGAYQWVSLSFVSPSTCN